MARRPTLPMKTLALATLILMTGAPLLAPLADTALPTMPFSPPQAEAVGLWGTVGATVLVGENPVAQSSSQGGRTDEEAHAVKLVLKSTTDSSVLADVRGLQDVAVANAQRFGGHSSMQARAHSQVLTATLLNGLITAKLLHASVFSSNGVRLDASPSITGSVVIRGLPPIEVHTTNQVVGITGVGTLTINETIVDQASGTITVNALHLRLAGDIEVIVGHAMAQTQRGTAGLPDCRTFTEAYPVGTNSVALGNLLQTRHWAVMGDPGASGEGHAKVYAAAVEDTAPTVLVVRAVGASDDLDSQGGTAKGAAQAEVLGVNVLNGLVQAEVIRASGHTSATGGDAPGASLSDAGSAFVKLSVLGTDVDTTPAPNTVNITLNPTGPTIGWVRINEQTRSTWTSGGMSQALLRINMVHIVLTTSYLGLQAGTQIVLGHVVLVSQCGIKGPLVLDFGDPIGIHAF
jgi:hypothetical protein